MLKENMSSRKEQLYQRGRRYGLSRRYCYKLADVIKKYDGEVNVPIRKKSI